MSTDLDKFLSQPVATTPAPTEISPSDLRDLRNRVLRGEHVEPEELAVVLDSIRRARRADPLTQETKKKAAVEAAARVAADLDDFLSNTPNKESN